MSSRDPSAPSAKSAFSVGRSNKLNQSPNANPNANANLENDGKIDNEKDEYESLYRISISFVRSFLDNPYVIVFMIIITLWSLFGNDIKYTSTTKSADSAFDGILSVIFVLYCIEILLTLYSKPDYFVIPNWKRMPNETLMDSLRRRFNVGGFYFWLDIISALSFIFELSWMIPSQQITLMSTAAGYASRERSTLARVNRLKRLFPLVRIGRLVKYLAILRTYYKKISVSQTSTSTTTGNQGGAEDEDSNNYSSSSESHVGAKMSDLTNQRVMVLVFSMLIIIPCVFITESDLTPDLATQFLNRMAYLNATNSTNFEQGLLFAVQNVITYANAIEIDITTYGTKQNFLYDHSLVNSLRPDEIIHFYANNQNPSVRTDIYFNFQQTVYYVHLYNIYTTIFVLALLVTSTYFFSNDVKKLVIGPIERMVELVREISANPLGVKYKMLSAADGFREGLETTVLLSTITKIGGLMRVGFGEAGANVIARNLAESSGGKLKIMGTGVMINSIFGFCDIRNFTDTTECLQEEVMLFVNRIAHILHNIVVQCKGSANKNIGDAFLLTWKVDDQDIAKPQLKNLADQALLAFLRTFIELSRHDEFICNFSAPAMARLLKRFPQYAVRIGCGLHYGWAIEGAIGSNRKIDASYLSPHVNFTEFLESSTKEYDVPLLISEPFFQMLSPSAQQHCRQVDRIRRNENEDPISLYTYDVDLSINFADVNRQRRLSNAPSLRHGGIRRSPSSRALVNNGATDLENPSHNTGAIKNAPLINISAYTKEIWNEDLELCELRHYFMKPEVKRNWGMGMGAYLNGEWDEAKKSFKKVLELTDNKDGPSKFLLKVMSETGYVAPKDWPGYRVDG